MSCAFMYILDKKKTFAKMDLQLLEGSLFDLASKLKLKLLLQSDIF